MASTLKPGSTKRLQKEIKDIRTSPLPGIHIDCDEEDITRFRISIEIEEDCPYQGGIYYFELDCPVDYPFRPPKTKVMTQIFHPNIEDTGKVCLDILRDSWSPALTIQKVGLALQSLITKPNFNETVNKEYMSVHNQNVQTALEQARDQNMRYAMRED